MLYRDCRVYYHLTHRDWQLLGGFDPHHTLYSSAPIIGAMTIIFVTLLSVAVWSEQGGNPTFAAMGIDQSQTSINPGGNMEGKEVRFGGRKLRVVGYNNNCCVEWVCQLDA